MTSITVIRGAGDVLGEDIVNVLAVTDAVAAQLGRNAIDADAKIRTVSLDSVHRANLRTGQVVEVADALQGRTWRGKVTGVDIAVESPSIITTLSLERV